ncbi:MAG: acetate/propionate family kinase [Candidatus Omnitrophica bacterium]|nr:acetate/propionate family kinase [Candidatus Omnitrophota bacterium]
MKNSDFNILVFNGGSSSLAYKIFQVKTSKNIKVISYGKAYRVGVRGTAPSFVECYFNNKLHKEEIHIANHRQAAKFILKYIEGSGIKIDYIGHRFVHGGSHFKESVFLNKVTLKKLVTCLPLAPIHNPVSLGVIYESRKIFPDLPQYVTFDSAFHSTIPYYAYTYALPRKIIKKFGFRKYGFHGLSYSYTAGKISKFLKKDAHKLKIVACHLGTGGSSVAAIKGGHSVDTSMGYSPLSGLMMSTRCGDIDPILMIYLMNIYGYRPDELMDILNKKSGLLGISGFSSDITDIIHKMYKGEGRKRARLAFNMYIHRLKKYIGSYIAVLGGIDALVFTDDIGVHNWMVRKKVCEKMKWAGIIMDNRMNRNISGDKVSCINSAHSKVKIVVIPTEEEFIICLEGIKLLRLEK